MKKKGTQIKLKFLREIRFPRFTMLKDEVWYCYEEWGTGRDYLKAAAEGEDRFKFAGGYCFTKDVEVI